MMVMALISWWYGAGWSRIGKRSAGRIDGAMAFFSIGLLLRTLFDPFRQIGVGKVQGPLAVQFRAWSDRAFSRCVGFVVRSVVIFFGLTVIAFWAAIAVLQLALWPVLPLLPLLGLVLTAVGWTP